MATWFAIELKFLGITLESNILSQILIDKSDVNKQDTYKITKSQNITQYLKEDQGIQL